jgi:hypothetical protein
MKLLSLEEIKKKGQEGSKRDALRKEYESQLRAVHQKQMEEKELDSHCSFVVKILESEGELTKEQREKKEIIGKDISLGRAEALINFVGNIFQQELALAIAHPDKVPDKMIWCFASAVQHDLNAMLKVDRLRAYLLAIRYQQVFQTFMEHYTLDGHRK